MAREQGELVPSERESGKRIIRNFFREHGAMPARELWTKVKDALPMTLRNALEVDGGIKLCREALTELEENGLPFAKPCGSENGLWKQLALFEYPEWHALIERESRAVVADWNVLKRYQDYCFQKFGKAPKIPELIVPENEQLAG